MAPMGRSRIYSYGHDSRWETKVWFTTTSLVYSLTFFREYDISVDTEEPPQILSFFGEEDFEVISG
jgi:hypothetical protein